MSIRASAKAGVPFFCVFCAKCGIFCRVKEYNAKWKFFGEFEKIKGNFKQVKQLD